MKNKMKKILKNKKIIFIVAIIIFITVTILLLAGKIKELDEYINNLMLNIRNNSLTNIMIVITNIGSSYALIALSLLLLFIIKKKRIPLAIRINLISVTLISQLFKFIIQRDRPEGFNILVESGYSYPSGHSMVSMAYYGLIAYLIYENFKSKVLKTILIITIFIGIFLIGFSRLYLGMHYFSDVISGFFAAIAYLMVFIHYYKMIIKKEDKK